MVNLSNTLFMRSLEARENERLRQQAMEQATWDRLQAGQEQIETAKDRAHARQLQQAETEGKIAAQLGEKAPQLAEAVLREAASRGHRGSLGEQQAAGTKFKREAIAKMLQEAQKQRGRTELQTMRDEQTRLGREATDERARLDRAQRGRHHRENLGVKQQRADQMLKRLESDLAKTGREARSKRTMELYRQMRLWSEQAAALRNVGKNADADALLGKIEAFGRLMVSPLSQEEQSAVLDHYLGLSPEEQPPRGFEETLGGGAPMPGPGGTPPGSEDRLAAVRRARARAGQVD